VPVNRRAQIAMSDAELRAFLGEEDLVTCATLGPNGRPHLMPLSYVLDPAEARPVIIAGTFGKSQKVRNLERVPEATLQVEGGKAYGELRGAMMECDVEIVRDVDAVIAIALAVAGRDGSPASAERRAHIAAQAPKRVGLRFHPTRVVSFDHRKLGGGY
jgi:hypothetical protein